MDKLTRRNKLVISITIIIACFIPIIYYGFVQEDTKKEEHNLRTKNGPSVDFSHGDLKVSDNGHFLVHEDQTPFFYMADTTWQLFARLDKDETEKYLENRREKGFTVIQSVAMARFGSDYETNQEGQPPLINGDVNQPNDAYFKHVDWTIKKAAEKGITIAMLPVWASSDVSVDSGIFNPNYQNQGIEIAKKKAYDFGLYLGKRYKDFQNIIWVLGGDTNPPGFEDIYRAMAQGLDEGDEGRHLMTYHPRYMNHYFHNESWLDFNMAQTSHVIDGPNYKEISKNYALKPAKPTVDGETRYEGIPNNFDISQARLSDFDVRQAQYWALFSGAFGIAFGNHNVWQLTDKTHPGDLGADQYWYESLDSPATEQMTYIRDLIESRPILKRIPDQSLIKSEQKADGSYMVATRAKDGSYAFIYSPFGGTIAVDMEKLSGKKIKAGWYNPRTGKTEAIGSFEKKGTKEFKAPSEGRGNDWVLLLDDQEEEYRSPGSENN